MVALINKKQYLVITISNNIVMEKIYFYSQEAAEEAAEEVITRNFGIAHVVIFEGSEWIRYY